MDIFVAYASIVWDLNSILVDFIEYGVSFRSLSVNFVEVWNVILVLLYQLSTEAEETSDAADEGRPP